MSKRELKVNLPDHTLGPWTVETTDYQGCYLVKQAEKSIGYKQDNANAQLISASPDLFRFVEKIEKIILASGHNLCSTATEAERIEFISSIIDVWNESGDDAITKARKVRS